MDFGFNYSNQWYKEPFHYQDSKIMRLLSNIGMEAIEVQLGVVNVINRNGKVNLRRKAKFFAMAENYGLKVGSIHAPYPNYSPTYLDLISGEKSRAAIQTLKNSAQIAHEVGAGVMVVHPSHTYGLHSIDRRNEKAVIEKVIQNLSILRDFVEKECNITVGIETMAPKDDRMIVGDRPQEIERIIRALNSKRVKVTWDMCHTYKSLMAYKLPVSDLKGIAKNTCHIHYSSYSPIISQCHCPTEFGKKTPIYEMLGLLKGYKGTVINEISPLLLLFLNPNLTLEEWLQKIIDNSKAGFEKWMH
ncbi:MAG: sugar phosphate isomerase/epimerase family protein [archaeon]